MTVLNKLEIDVMQASELDEAANLAFKHSLPALVIHPGLASEGHIARGRVRGKFKIIIPVDWPKGETAGNKKLQGLNVDALEADGFEILLSPGKSEVEIRKEAQEISHFIRNHISAVAEIRFVLGTSTIDDITEMVKGLLKIPTPAYIRNDTKTKAQISKANTDIHNQTIAKIREIIHAPIKICGNIADIRTMGACQNVSKFGVNLLQAKAIIKEFKQQPDTLRELLN